MVVAAMPSMEVESSPVGPDVVTRFRRAVTHDNGGVFYFPDGKAFAQRLFWGSLMIKVGQLFDSRPR